MQIINAQIKLFERVKDDIIKLTLQSDYSAQNARAGQFINIKCADNVHPLLRRPISIFDINRERGEISVVFQVKGDGTSLLAQKKVGDVLNFTSPYGTPFDLSKKYNNIAVVGGGIGVYPLYALLKESNAPNKSAFLGFRSKNLVTFKEEFKKQAGLYIATDDGSEGHHGLITEPLTEEAKKQKFDIIYACGPMPMLRAVSRVAHELKIPCQVSMEEKMGCGIGACLVCACKTKNKGELEYSHVCTDGPVFWSDEIEWEA